MIHREFNGEKRKLWILFSNNNMLLLRRGKGKLCAEEFLCHSIKHLHLIKTILNVYDFLLGIICKLHTH